MKNRFKFIALAVVGFLILQSSIGSRAYGQGTAFTYQGRLNSSNAPTTGSYDIAGVMCSGALGANFVSGVITNTATPVSNGLFTVTFDFGPGIFDGTPRWLALFVRSNGVPGFTTLLPRQSITAAPYAITASNVLGSVSAAQISGTIAAGNIAAGTITAVMLAPGAVSSLGASDGSPTNAVQVNTNGLVGIGTNSPAAGLHITAGANISTLTRLYEIQEGQNNLFNFESPVGVAVSGGLLAVSSLFGDSVSIFSVTNPAAPVLLSQLVDGAGGFTKLSEPWGLAWSGSNLVVASQADDTVTIISMTNPVSPVKLAELQDGVGGWTNLAGARSVAVNGNLLAIAAGTDNGLTLADISNPSAPVLIGSVRDGNFSYTNLYDASGVALNSNLLAVSAIGDDTVTLLNISNPNNIFKASEIRQNIGGFTNIDFPFGVAISGNLLAIAGYSSHAVTLVDVSNPAAPVKLSELRNGVDGYELFFARNVSFFGNLLVISASVNNTVTLVDVSNPSNPRRLATAKYGVNGMDFMGSPQGVCIVGTNIYVAGSGSDGLTVMGIENKPVGLYSAGWVGIGTTEPVAPLHVVGNVQIESAEYFDANANHVALGVQVEAVGTNSTALGFRSVANGDYSLAAGYRNDASGFAAVALGNENTASAANTVALGFYNRVTNDCAFAGGFSNRATGVFSVALGNKNIARGDNAIAIGSANTASGAFATAMGTSTYANGTYSTALGFATSATGTSSTALGDTTQASGSYATAMGESTTASGSASVAMGNASTASGNYSIAMGLLSQASGDYTLAVGRSSSATNDYCIALGRRAKSIHKGSFVWADSTDADVSSTQEDQFLVRASGGVRIYSDTNLTAGVRLPSGGTAWAVISDRNVKKDFASINTMDILKKLSTLTITQWRYNWENTETPPHIGPMAQDFKAAFYPGSDDKSITTLEADGVAFAAIQGLNQKLEELAKEKDLEIRELRQAVAELQKTVRNLNKPTK